MALRVLVADDNEDTRRILQRMLTKWGYSPVVVADGTAALAALTAEDPPPIALLDWMMPGVDGPEICRRVRAHDPGRRTLLFLATARGGTDDLVQGLEAGADDYVTKPFELSALRARLMAGVRGRLESEPASPRPLQAESLVADRYRLVRLLAEGGMGAVWEAVHVGLGTRVAIKFIHAAHIEDPCVRARFEMEAKATSRLSSAHVTRVLDYGVTAEGVPYLVMEFLRGQTLAAAVDERGRLPLSEVAPLVRQIARALTAAHTHGILHRDLKPENVFLAEPDEEPLLCTDTLGYRVKILDFGVAKVLDDAPSGTPRHAAPRVTQPGLLVGTLEFMSPEQLTDQPIGPTSDLWALGAVTYYALTGREPFGGKTIADVALSICEKPLPLAEAYVPAGFDAWFAKACAREPSERFDDAQEMALELARLSTQDRPAPKSAHPAALTQPPPKRRALTSPRLAVALALAAATFSALMTLFLR